jgi:serpin B
MMRISLCISLFALLFVSCEKDSGVETPKDMIPVNDVQTVSRMSSDFGWNLFHEVTRGVTEENVLISPLSVQTALTMALNGASSQTRSEMLEALACAGCSVSDLNEQTAKLRELMEEQSGHPTLTSANGYFYDPARIHVLDKFIQTLSDDYRTGFQQYDFDDPATVDKINGWVKDNTNGKIDKILDEIGGLDLAFLINALHFKADWATGFAPESTYSGKFFTGDNREVDLLYVTADRNFSTATNDKFRLVDIPFKDSTYSMSFVQPLLAVASQSDWVLELSSNDLKALWDSLNYGRAIVSFPRLDLEYDNGLIDYLKALGMEQAFSESAADFSEMGHALIGPVIYISKVRHKAVLKVDEKGAEGAAVTSIGFSTTSLPPSFTFNNPFLVVLRHTATNAIVFAGLVNDPDKK